MKVTVLIENTGKSPLRFEHGLSFFIEYRNHVYLLDSGTSGDFIDNARLLHIPLDQTACCFLSHGHYDHAGGFARFLKEYPDKQVYASEHAFESHYSISGGILHDIGIPDSVIAYASSFVNVNQVTRVAPDINLIPHVPGSNQTINKEMLKIVDNQFIIDDFDHEMSVVFEKAEGLVIFNSCSHSGVEAIIEDVKAVFPDTPIIAYLGGLHLKGKKDGEEICNYTRDEVHAIARYLQKEVQMVYTGHCTGDMGYQYLAEVLQDQIMPLITGQVIEI